jgi:hypothetical protein
MLQYPFDAKLKDGRFTVEIVRFTSYGCGISLYKNPNYFRDLTLGRKETNFSMGLFTLIP